MWTYIFISLGKIYMHVVAALQVYFAAKFTIVKICSSIDKWAKKMWYIYTTKYYSAKQNKIGFFRGWAK